MFPNPFREARRIIESVLFTILFLVILCIFACSASGCGYQPTPTLSEEGTEDILIEEVLYEDILVEETWDNSGNIKTW